MEDEEEVKKAITRCAENNGDGKISEKPISQRPTRPARNSTPP